jgi:hypothetical protein
VKTYIDKPAYCGNVNDVITFAVSVKSVVGMGIAENVVTGVLCPIYFQKMCNYQTNCSTVKDVAKQVHAELNELM